MSALFLYFTKACPAISMAGIKDKSIKKRTHRELNKVRFLILLRKVCLAIYMARTKEKSIKKRTLGELNECTFLLV